MDLLLSTRPSEPRSVVICGELDVGTVAPVRSYIAPLVEEPLPVRLDLAGVTFLDCATLGLLVTLSQRARAAGGSLSVTGLRRHPRGLVRMFRLEEVLGTSRLEDLSEVLGGGVPRRGAGE